jgi:MFS family permease
MTSNPAGSAAARTAASGASAVLLLLASAQFLMVLDSSVMNVSIAAVAEDVGTTVTGIQTAITLYTLVMASLMVTGGKVGAMIGHRRAFSIGIVVYASGSFVTAISPSLPVLIIGWSFLEGIGAALIMPALVALVAANFPPNAGRPPMGRSPPRPRWPSRPGRSSAAPSPPCSRGDWSSSVRSWSRS